MIRPKHFTKNLKNFLPKKCIKNGTSAGSRVGGLASKCFGDGV